MRILVLGGGISPEREVSLRSADNVYKALRNAGFNVVFYDPANGVDELLKLAKTCDMVFPILHGVGGEDGTLQKIFEKNKIKFLGSDSKASQNCSDKFKFYKICRENGIKVPETEVVNKSSIKSSPLSLKPFVLKPINGGSAIDTFIERKVPEDLSIFDEVFNEYKEMILEQLIKGVEVTDGILDKRSLPVIEIIPPPGEEFDSKNRYNGRSQELCPPENIDKKTQEEIQNITLRVHNLLGCRHWSRTDMIVGNDGIYVLELNTIPGITKASLFPKEAEAIGLSMDNLVKEFVRLVQNE